jgi:uncharacterized protein YceK
MNRLLLFTAAGVLAGVGSGCGTVVGWADPPDLQLSAATDPSDKRFLGIRLDAHFLSWADSNNPGGLKGVPWFVTTGLLGGVDLCASAVADTLLLPVALLSP